MTTLVLVRHALVDTVGHSIAGWLSGVGLNAEGREQAARLAERLARAKLAAVYSSPLERAIETATPLAERHGLEVVPRERLGEVRFGAWTGRTIDGLAEDETWRRFNAYRSGTRIPGGEMMLEVQARALGECADICRRHPEAAVAVVSHADVIRALLLHFVGAPLDLFLRLEVDPASVSVVEAGEYGARILTLNNTDRVPVS